LGHCGGCHTPRDAFGGETTSQALSGGTVDAWHAPALDEYVAAPSPWTVDQMTAYLRTGFDEQHGIAAGPMAAVTRNLQQADADDVRAMAVYVVDRMGGHQRNAAPVVDVATRNGDQGAAIYESACAGCHDRAPRGIALDRSTTVTDVVPDNLIRITLDGIAPPDEQRGRIMPSFRGTFTNDQMTALIEYIRGRYGRIAAWPDAATTVEKLQRMSPENPS
jgi:mono/diheme cytochrome c family protein